MRDVLGDVQIHLSLAEAAPRVIVVIAVIAALAITLSFIQFARMAWRFLRGNEELEAGGSWGSQLTKRNRDDDEVSR